MTSYWANVPAATPGRAPTEAIPRHARAYADLAALQRQINTERVRALTAFRADIAAGQFPDDSEVAHVEDAELARLVDLLDNG